MMDNIMKVKKLCKIHTKIRWYLQKQNALGFVNEARPEEVMTGSQKNPHCARYDVRFPKLLVIKCAFECGIVKV